ncbi:Diacylglycerol kinase (ATP) protein [Dioscorea alata]|uniref:Diacylglycerol kinase (ATP) protein n=1 Tax=Dioscorea alata TaxID=55571 RepID=A0ACB7VDF6_DIOAL|nr:Diacylglycerol kinase (ATP) protein [Dioscorea alata]
MATSSSASSSASEPSIWSSFRNSWLRIGKQELRRMVEIPSRIARAMTVAAMTKDADGLAYVVAPEREGRNPPEAPVVVFVNSRSGGRHGLMLKDRLQMLIGKDQVYDLSCVKPDDFVQYGLGCLEKLASLGDLCAKSIREKLRIMVAGGDGTVGWVLGSLAELHAQNRTPVPPIGIIPLGTGNDLSRSFGWGGSFPFTWRTTVKNSIHRAVTGPVCHLDSWEVVISVPALEPIDLPHCLRQLDDRIYIQDGDNEEQSPLRGSCYKGVFYNYFSVGMDAQVAYGFHHLRDEKPYIAQSPIANKLIYTGYGCTQGWFMTPCMTDASFRGLKNILRLYIKRFNSTEWEQIHVPKSARAIVALNLHSYGGGRNPWGNPKPEYLEKRGFVEAHVDDGLLEIFGLKQGWHASFVMVELIPAKHITQAAAIRLEMRGGEWRDAYMQMDGEPWKQPITGEYSTTVIINRMPFQSLLIAGDVSVHHHLMPFL